MNFKIQPLRDIAFENLFDSVISTDLKGKIIDWNPASESIFGYGADEAIGQPYQILLLPEEQNGISKEIQSSIGLNGQWAGEVRMLHKQGYTLWIESRCIAAYDNNQQLAGHVYISRDITDRKQDMEHKDHLAHFDALTGIPNRHLLLARMAHLIHQSERNLRSFAVVYIDLDNFNAINESKGHAFGDLVLVEAAFRLKNTLRDSDTVARVGGDEFILILEDISDKHQISDLARKLNQALNEKVAINEVEIDLSCSLAIAIYPDDGETVDDLLAVTDSAMRKAKAL